MRVDARAVCGVHPGRVEQRVALQHHRQQPQREYERCDLQTIPQPQQRRAVHLHTGMSIGNLLTGQRHPSGHLGLHARQCPHLRGGRRGEDILAGDDAVRPRGRHRGEVHLQIARQFADRRLGPRPPRGVHPVVGAVSHQHRLLRLPGDAHQHRADRQCFAFAPTEFGDAPGERAGDLHLGFVGLQRAQGLVQRHLVPDGHRPAGDGGFLQALAEIGDAEFEQLGHCLSAFSTQSSRRSTPGNHSFSSRAGG